MKQIERLKDCWKAAKEAASGKKKRAYSYADGYLDGIEAAQILYEQKNNKKLQIDDLLWICPKCEYHNPFIHKTCHRCSLQTIKV